MVQQTEQTMQKTRELVEKFDRAGRRISAVELRAEKETSALIESPVPPNVN